eukprot:33139_1
MSLYGVSAEFSRTEGMELVDPNEVRSWRIGSQLVYALLVDAHYPSHKDGVPVFLDLMGNLAKYIQDETSITVKDTIKMFDVVVKENKPHLLAKLLNHSLIPNSSYNGNIAKNSLKQAIRVGSLNILDYLIQQNVQIISNDKEKKREDKNKYDDIRSLIFNILQSVRVGYKANKVNNLIIAHKFWSYLAESLYDLYHEKDITDNAQPQLKYNGVDQGDTTELSQVRCAKFLISNPLIVCSIYKSIHSSLSGKHYVDKLKPILHFVCEHYMRFDDPYDLEELHDKCHNDRCFDCGSLKSFNIRTGHALEQSYAQIKAKRMAKLFWSEYILIKLINDYLGIDPNKMNTAKRMDQYGVMKIDAKQKDERGEMLYCIRYIVSNGGANHVEDLIGPLLEGYKKQFVRTDEDGEEMDKVVNAVQYGANIWRLRELKDDEMAQLFENVCDREIELPLQIVSFIISFVVL